MFVLNKKLLMGLLSCFIFCSFPVAYSEDEYYGAVKFGTYNCVMDGETCNFERYEDNTEMNGDGCPSFEEKMSKEVKNQIMAEFLNSKYCRFTPTTVKKYMCRSADGPITLYMKDGIVINAIFLPGHKSRKNLQSYYNPNECIETGMFGDNGKPAFQNEIDWVKFKYFEKLDPQKYLDKSYIQEWYIKYYVGKSVKKETAVINEDISFLNNEINNVINKKIRSLEKYFLFLAIGFGVILLITFIVLFKSNNSPYKRL